MALLDQVLAVASVEKQAGTAGTFRQSLSPWMV